ncbi:ABC transporter permease subunit [Rivibacter subsaxonicus]|uniref:Dipeptide transport system permease protein n=1 Tax=Rivibacter subsaxonicus TaxID=457575 RepID=A0A4Q7VB85_9BURK|nr:ABC transporter permease subunit [Rivibacter subsaxonicus]RZT93885.1 dipeptide transport system permease protein [Rivibacter subsaxonicus]
MLAFFLKRLALVIPTFVGITLLAFSLIHLIPGDPVQVMAGERRLDPEFYAETLKRLGLDRPLYEQYGAYLLKAVQLDLGESFVTHESVWSEFLKLFPATVELALCAMLFATVLGLLAGVLAALKRGSWLDHGVMGLSLTGFSMPIFWWGLLLIMFFSVQMREIAPALALPVSGRIGLEFDIEPRTGFMLIDTWLAGDGDAFRSALSHLVLPAIVLGTVPLAVIARMTRSSMLEVLREDYVRTARAKGLAPARVVFVHALRNALVPVITVIGLLVGSLLGGAVLTETIFSWPGVGKWLVDAIGRRDYPVVQGGILISAALVILVNLAVDLLYGLVNPRIRHAH